MNSFPIVVRELVVGARRPRTIWTRVQAGAVGILLGVCVYILSETPSAQQLGNNLFTFFAGLIFFYCLIAGALVTSDCVSSEKRDGTLGLLFLTDLSGYDVVLGKLAATSLTAVYGILTLFPVLAVSFVLGGVDPRMFGRVFLAAFNLLFFSLSAGMVASAICDRESRAFGLTLVIVAAMNLLPLGLTFGLNSWFGPNRQSWYWDVLFLCPCHECVLALDFKKTLLDKDFLASLGITQLYTWLFLVVSSRLVPQAWQHREPVPKRQTLRLMVRRLVEGTELVNKTWRTACLDRNAYFWLAARQKHRDRGVWALILAWIGAWVYWAYANRDLRGYWVDWLDPQFCIVAVMTLQVFIKGWIALQASQQFIEDRRSGALELLLCTPLSPRVIIAGQWLALQAQFGRPLVAVLIIEILLFLLGMPKVRGENWLGMWSLFWTGNLVVTCADIWAVAFQSMANSVWAKGAAKAAFWAMAKVMLLPWMTCWVLAALIEAMGLTPDHLDGSKTILVCFGVLFLVSDLVFAASARRKLHRGFAALAVADLARRKRRQR